MDVVYLCPSTPKGHCNWQGPASDIVPHFENCHVEAFLRSNQFNLDVSEESDTNYLMHLLEDTFLIQTTYEESQMVELKLRYLGSPNSAAKIRYYIEVTSGNFGFTSKSDYYGYNAVTTTPNGSIEIDVQGIKLTCGKRRLENLTVLVHIENQHLLKSFGPRRRHSYDRNYSNGNEVKINVKRTLSQPVSTDYDCKEFAEICNHDIKNKFQYEELAKNCENEEEETVYYQFVNEIVVGIIEQVLKELDKKSQEENDSRISKANESVKLRRSTSMRRLTFRRSGRYSSTDYDSAIEAINEESAFYNNVRDDAFYELPNEDTAENTNTSETKTGSPSTENPIFVTDTDDKKDNVEVDTKINGEEEDSVGQNDDDDKEDIVIRTRVGSFRYLNVTSEKYRAMLQLIYCTTCSMYMTPPIFTCENKHCVCKTCKPHKCELCKGNVTYTRSHELEEFSRRLAHPCRFSAKGCRELHNYNEIRHHEIFCDFFKYQCPKCGNIDKFLVIKNHIKIVHPSLKLFESCDIPFGRDSEFLAANKFGMFYCTSVIKHSAIEWTVRFCGLKKISFGCDISIRGKKTEKTFSLAREGNSCSVTVSFNELKAAKVKEKYAVLHISGW